MSCWTAVLEKDFRKNVKRLLEPSSDSAAHKSRFLTVLKVCISLSIFWYIRSLPCPWPLLKIHLILSNGLGKEPFSSLSKSPQCCDYEHVMPQLAFARRLGIELQSSRLCGKPLPDWATAKTSRVRLIHSLRYKGNSAWCLWFVIPFLR